MREEVNISNHRQVELYTPVWVRPLNADQIENINRPEPGRVGGIPMYNPTRYNEAVERYIESTLTPPVENLTIIDSTRVHDIRPDKKYIELKGVVPVEHLQGRPVVGSASEHMVPFVLLATDPWQSLMLMPNQDSEELGSIFNKYEIPNEDLSYASELALAFLGRDKKVDELGERELSAFRTYVAQNPNVARTVFVNGIKELKLPEDVTQRLIKIGENKLRVYLPTTYNPFEAKGENSILSSIVSGKVPDGVGVGLNTPIYAMVIGATLGPNILENPVAKMFNDIVERATDPVLIITGHGNTYKKGYVLGENFHGDENETLEEIMRRLTENGQRYSCVIITGCNEKGTCLEEVIGLDTPVFYTNGLHSIKTLYIGASTSVGFDPKNHTKVEYRHDPDAMMGIYFDGDLLMYRPRDPQIQSN